MKHESGDPEKKIAVKELPKSTTAQVSLKPSATFVTEADPEDLKPKTLLESKPKPLNHIQSNMQLEHVSSINQRRFVGKFKDIDFYS